MSFDWYILFELRMPRGQNYEAFWFEALTGQAVGATFGSYPIIRGET